MRRRSSFALASLLALAALACASPIRPIEEADRLGGAPVRDTSFRVKERVSVPGPLGALYVLPIGEYRPSGADEQGIFYSAPQGVLERAGFSKRPVAGGIFLPSAPARPWDRPLAWVERGDGRPVKLAIPASAVPSAESLRFAIAGEEQP